MRAGRYSLVINHAPWAVDRQPTLDRMIEQLTPDPDDGSLSWWLHKADYRGGGPNPKGGPVDFTLAQWRWSAQQPTDYHVFMTDDLEIAPHFWDILDAMTEELPASIIGLLSNHPDAPKLEADGIHWYRTNSWVVGPCYVVPHVYIARLLEWAEARHPKGEDTGLGWSDDSELNEWITTKGPGEAWHPIPTPIEHMRTESTWIHTGHGDAYSHECVSWRTCKVEPAAMRSPVWWMAIGAPMLRLP